MGLVAALNPAVTIRWAAAMPAALLFPAMLLIGGCAEDKPFSPVGNGASLTPKQQQSDEEIEGIIRKQLGEGVDPDGGCPAGYIVSGDQCVKQEIYRLLKSHYRITASEVIGGALQAQIDEATAQPVTVYRLNIVAVQPDDAIYLFGNLQLSGIEANTAAGIEVSVIHKETGKTVARSFASITESMGFVSVPLSGIHLIKEEGAAEYTLQATLKRSAFSTDPTPKNLGIVASGQLSALHYTQFTVNDVFGGETSGPAFYQVSGLPVFEADAGIEEGQSNGSTLYVLTGPQKKVLKGKTLEVKKGDILVLQWSAAFDYFDNPTACSGNRANPMEFFFTLDDTPIADYPMPAFTTSMVLDGSSHRVADAQQVNGFHIQEIAADATHVLSVLFKQADANCRLLLRNKNNSYVMTYELYRPLKDLKANKYKGKFLAEVTSMAEAASEYSAKAHGEEPAEHATVSGTVNARALDCIFIDGSLAFSAGVTDFSQDRIETKVWTADDAFQKESGNPTLSHSVNQSLSKQLFQATSRVHGMTEVFESMIPVGQVKPMRLSLKAQFTAGGPKMTEQPPQQSVSVSQASISMRLFRIFGAFKPAD